jgi:hypothetical protein
LLDALIEAKIELVDESRELLSNGGVVVVGVPAADIPRGTIIVALDVATAYW